MAVRRPATAATVSVSRRQVLTGAVAAALGTAVGTSTVARAASAAPAGSDLGAVEHVVFLMLENRSFDHYFGTYRGVRGFDDHPPGRPGVFAQSWPGGNARRLLPFRLDTASENAECTTDLSHEWIVQHQCWNGGRMDRFVSTHTSAGVEGPEGVLTMGYYERQDLPFWYALADAFTIGDGYHCSVMGPTHPNRLHALSGTLDPGGVAGGPVLYTNSSPSAIGSVHWPTMPEVLEADGISWKVYNAPGDIYLPSNPISASVTDNILFYFAQHVSDETSPLYTKAFLPVFPADFARDAANGTLPQVSWIAAPIGDDEHPPAPPAAAMWFAHQVLGALAANPTTWSKTVLFIMYDENDGFFDHVAPPVPPPGTKGEYLTVDPLPPVAGGVRGPIGLGFRVPLLVVSPFSRGGYVCSDTFDHTSQLRFLETRFGVRAPGITPWRRSVTGDLAATLDVHRPDRSVPRLPATDPKSALVRRECTPGQLLGIDVAHPTPFPVPAHQALPRQEPGTARRR
ncbi:MAG TPA: alkaline phosphatase family protein [Acidimicrobiales bacterium]|nr:alkaline phosphatase family protein [Acidimicrobiales bacterium]